MTQSITGVLDGLYAAAQTLYADITSSDDAPVLVTYGLPGNYQPNAIVAIGVDVRLPVTRPTMGSNRSRETTAEIDCVISVYEPGDETAQRAANTQALALLAALEGYFRVRPNEELGGACREAWVSGSSLAPSVAFQQYDDPSTAPVATGRTADITVTITASIRT